MSGRFPGWLPSFANRPWVPQETGMLLDEILRKLFDSTAILNRTPGTPTEIEAGAVPSPGTTSGIATAALEDHVHPVDISGTPGVVGIASVQGVGPGLATTDHTHRLGVASVKGDLIVSNGSNPVALPVGASDGMVLVSDPTTSTGLRWSSDVEMLAWLGL